MIEDQPLRILRLRLTYLLIIILVVLFQTLPIQTSPYQFATPDLPLAITFAWIMRRPTIMSPILITIAFLFADAILQRPPGLWTLVVLCASMFLRMRALGFREVVFFYEWALVTIVVCCAFIVHHFALMFTFLPTHDLTLYTLQAVFTFMIYPLFIWIFRPMLRYALTQTLHKSSSKAAR